MGTQWWVFTHLDGSPKRIDPFPSKTDAEQWMDEQAKVNAKYVFEVLIGTKTQVKRVETRVTHQIVEEKPA